LNDTPAEITLARVVRRDEGFGPGDDLESLVSRFASIEFVDLPFKADGISVKLKSPGQQPHIIINSDNPPTRKKFTLAHELGHVLIPWHVGTICSHIDATEKAGFDYYEQELEANHFASELLLPAYWIQDLFSANNNPAEALAEMTGVAQVSPHAAIIKLMQDLPPGYVCLQTHPDMPPQGYRSPGTFVSPPYSDSKNETARFDRLSAQYFSLQSRKYHFRWWFIFQNHSPPEQTLSRPWRESLADILQAVAEDRRYHVQQSLNGIIASAANKSRSPATEDAYRHVINRVNESDYGTHLLDHPEFASFVLTRIMELRNR
jgi:IrrE N-terminal-like domain